MLFEKLLYSGKKLVSYPIQNESVGGIQSKFIRTGLSLQRPDPGVELLGGKLTFETIDTGLPVYRIHSFLTLRGSSSTRLDTDSSV